MQQLQAAGIEAGSPRSVAAAVVAAAGGRRAADAAFEPGAPGGRGQALIERANAAAAATAAERAGTARRVRARLLPGHDDAVRRRPNVTLGVGDERSGVDFQLQLVPTARIEGVVTNAGRLDAAGHAGLARAAGSGRRAADSRAQLEHVAIDAERTLSVHRRGAGTIPVDGARGHSRAGRQPAGGTRRRRRRSDGRPRRTRRPGRNPAGALGLDGSHGQRPEHHRHRRSVCSPACRSPDACRSKARRSRRRPISRACASISTTRGQQMFEGGAMPPAQVDAGGRFTITGVAPGRYSINGGVPAGGQAAAEAAPAQGGAAQAGGAARRSGSSSRRSPADATSSTSRSSIEPNQEVGGIVMTFTDRTQELSGTLQDATGQADRGFHDRRLPGGQPVLAAAVPPDRVGAARHRRPVHVPQPPARRLSPDRHHRRRARRMVQSRVPGSARAALDCHLARRRRTKGAGHPRRGW